MSVRDFLRGGRRLPVAPPADPTLGEADLMREMPPGSLDQYRHGAPAAHFSPPPQVEPTPQVEPPSEPEPAPAVEPIASRPALAHPVVTGPSQAELDSARIVLDTARDLLAGRDDPEGRAARLLIERAVDTLMRHRGEPRA